VVAGWWDRHRAKVPDVHTATLLADRLNLFAGLKAMAADHFVGRVDLLRQMREHATGADPVPFAVHGIGGIGKSALIARHVVWAIDDINGLGGYAAVLDFDDPTLNPVHQLDVVHRIIGVIGRQATGPVRRRLDRLVQVAVDAGDTTRYRGQTSSRAVGASVAGVLEELLDDLVRFVDRPLLVVFDTVEQVQRRGSSAAVLFTELVEVLTRFGSRIRVVVAGRAEIPGLPARSHALVGLDRTEAVKLLTRLCVRPIDIRTADAVIDALGTSPLTVRLAARLLSDAESEPGDLLALDLHAERVNAELYWRVLAHIRDEQVRRLAHPGLVLRRITPEIIAQVLSRPCKVPVPDAETARDLFDRLGQEAMLVDRTSDDDILVHRADVRRMMLPQALADSGRVARRIQRSAVQYYTPRTDPASRTEELYHRLLLGQAAATLDRHWDRQAAESLLSALDELPTVSRIYLMRRLPETYLSDSDRQLVDDARWSDEIHAQVLRLLSAGNPRQAMGLLSERRAPDGGSLLPSLEIEALEAMGELPAAVALTRDCRRAASIANDPAGVTTYTLHLARLQERGGDPTSAAAALEETLRSLRAPTVDRLRLLVTLLGLWRRQGHPPGWEHEPYLSEAVRLHDHLGNRQIRQVPGLLRDLAAEASATRPAILDDALKTIGVDASPGGPIPAALQALDESVAAERGTSGLVADIAQLDRSEKTVAWEEIVTKPRGETGRALLDVIRTFGPSADQMRSAVRAAYRAETDAAFFGERLNIGHKA
jgi:hypothetical protein